jgi:hypothetical protein
MLTWDLVINISRAVSMDVSPGVIFSQHGSGQAGFFRKFSTQGLVCAGITDMSGRLDMQEVSKHTRRESRRNDFFIKYPL